MANRHLARTIALQSLFEWDFNNAKDSIEQLVERHRQEFAPDFDDQGFCLHLVIEIIESVILSPPITPHHHNNPYKSSLVFQNLFPMFPIDFLL